MEEWKDIPGWEGKYQASSLGRIKSVKRNKIMKPYEQYGYHKVSLAGPYRTLRVHQLVAMTFLEHEPNGLSEIVHHKNHDKLDNRLENLEVTTQRRNRIATEIANGNKYPGVRHDKVTNTYRPMISFGGHKHYIGNYNTPEEAHQAYMNKILEIEALLRA